ncbi:MAPEG family protein [Devosia equisanguinis]|uniref:MAPEG family protein n=1 Tax=Devosia equisanguinis TaxID=2490941 RepID=A0A3S5D3I6_9HYPH|nr:MAPEG family protein [Devosia equisanguinis]VDS05500.1 MAPEG family protein [Devosia equisanguinis]
MSVELTLLTWSAALAFAYVMVQSTAYRLDYGIKFAGSQRDNERPPNKWAARGNRALRNFLETYGIFIALAVATELSGRSDSLTQWGAQLWFWARWAYIPGYFIDIPLLRSGIWMVSLIGLVLLFVGVAF